MRHVTVLIAKHTEFSSWLIYSNYMCDNLIPAMAAMSENLCPLGAFLILERAKNHRVLSQMNKVDGPFL
jgi:hypothetical protein